MRVLMLGWELPPHNSGGLGVACLQLSKALADSGADISFVLPSVYGIKHDFMEIVSAMDLPADFFILNGVYDSRLYGSASSWESQQSAYAEMVGRLISKRQFDVVHAHDWLTFRAGLLVKQKTNCPLILHVHSIERDRAGGEAGNPLVREIEATAMLLADHVFTVSQRTKRMIVEDYKIPADKIEVAHNSLDLANFEPLDSDNAYKYLEDMKKLGWRVVVSVGRLTIQKGLSHLLQSAKEVAARRPKTFFVIVGDGDQREELIRLAADHGISRNIIFTGFQRGKHWRDAFAAGDLFVMPSVSEPFGLTPFEAAGYGTPSLISYQSGASEVLQNCLKVDYWDVNLMTDKILGALNSQALLDEMSANARAEFYRLSWKPTARKIIDRYEKIISGATA